MPDSAGTWWYELDAQDRVAAVGGERDPRAPRNALTAPALGQSLWAFVDGLETAHVLRRILRGVRGSGAAVEVPYRCDRPGIERHMQFRAAPLADGRVRVTIRLLREVPCSGPPDPPPALPESGMIAMCSWCNQIRLGDDVWIPPADAAARLGMFCGLRMPPITHGICAGCLAIMLPLVDGAAAPAESAREPATNNS